jgi:hypothetical protein
MTNPTAEISRDWLSSKRTNLLAWWIPHAAILAGLFVPVPVRALIWVIALGLQVETEWQATRRVAE